MFRSQRRLLGTASLITACCAAVLLPDAAALAATPLPVEAGQQYVALGSSYAAGGGLLPADPTDRDGCGRSESAYPYLVASRMHLQLAVAACGGATTANIASEQQITRHADGSVSAVPLQLDAVKPETDLVTLTVGGNDVNYVAQLYARTCQSILRTDPTNPTANGLKQYGACTAWDAARVDDAVGQLRTKLEESIRAVQSRAPHARVLVVDYLTMVPANKKACAALPLDREDQRYVGRLADDISSATKKAASTTGVELVAVSQISRGHDACATDPWVTGWDFTSGAAAMHPNAAGHRAVADEVIQQLTYGRTPSVRADHER